MSKRVSPTKANLFEFQKQLKFASEGCDLLHQKRDVLVMELMSEVSNFNAIEKRLNGDLEKALDNLNAAVLANGSESLGRTIAAQQKELEIEIKQYSVMGIILPRISIATDSEPEFGGLLDTDINFDNTVNSLHSLLSVLSEYIEIISSVWRMATEIEKTQKRINALENIFIPEAKQTINWIKSVMEETDREELFRRKLLKSRSL